MRTQSEMKMNFSMCLTKTIHKKEWSEQKKMTKAELINQLIDNQLLTQ